MTTRKHHPNWGGLRQGAGPPVQFSQGLKRRTVSLPPEHLRFLEELGAGNLSLGLRRLIEEKLTTHEAENID